MLCGWLVDRNPGQPGLPVDQLRPSTGHSSRERGYQQL